MSVKNRAILGLAAVLIIWAIAEATGLAEEFMGDPAIEELFVLTARVGIENVAVVIAPNDLRKDGPRTDLRHALPWTDDLYQQVRDALPEAERP